MDYSPWGRKESDTTERLSHTHNEQKNEHQTQGDCELRKDVIKQRL